MYDYYPLLDESLGNVNNLLLNPNLFKTVPLLICNLQRAQLLNPGPQLLSGTLVLALLRRRPVLEIGEQRDDVFLVLVEFVAECPALRRPWDRWLRRELE